MTAAACDLLVPILGASSEGSSCSFDLILPALHCINTLNCMRLQIHSSYMDAMSAINPILLCTVSDVNLKSPRPPKQPSHASTSRHNQTLGSLVGCRSNTVSLSHGVFLPGRGESGGLHWGSAAPALYCLAGAQSEGGNP